MDRKTGHLPPSVVQKPGPGAPGREAVCPVHSPDAKTNSPNSPSTASRYSEAAVESLLSRLLSYYPRTMELGLERVYRLLEAVGNPHENLPPVIHVAGTNGKGSTLAFLRAIMEEYGLRVHRYTSPHLVQYNERILLAGQHIENRFLVETLEECEQINAGRPITFFEIGCVAAFLAFSRVPADVLLLETGLGGRLDATNVISRPAVTVITSISYDHEKFLGETIQKIAIEKAGIIKKETPCIIGYQSPHSIAEGVYDILLQQANTLNAPAYIGGKDWTVTGSRKGKSLIFEGFDRKMKFPAPALPGAHQFENAGAAIAAFLAFHKRGSGSALFSRHTPESTLGAGSRSNARGNRHTGKVCGMKTQPDQDRKAIIQRLSGPILQTSASASSEIIGQGLRKARWPARLQRLHAHEKSRRLPAGIQLWLDGGHNESAGTVLAAQARRWREEEDPAPSLDLIVGMIDTKEPHDFLKELARYAKNMYFVPVPDNESSYSPAQLSLLTKDIPLRPSVKEYDSWEEALHDLVQRISTSENPEKNTLSEKGEYKIRDGVKAGGTGAGSARTRKSRILICGSLYLSGCILASCPQK